MRYKNSRFTYLLTYLLTCNSPLCMRYTWLNKLVYFQMALEDVSVIVILTHAAQHITPSLTFG